jgi:hypothetical protein
MSLSAFIIFYIISSQRFYFSMFYLIQCLLPLFLCPFIIIYQSMFCPFNDFYYLIFFPSTFCHIQRFVHGCFLLQSFVGESCHLVLLRNGCGYG